jgi:serine/threonine-protein kinase
MDDQPTDPMSAPGTTAGRAAGELIAGKYRLDEILGEGAMGEVWHATQLGLDRGVAVKVLRADVARHADARARFAREARVAATLHHPGAVSVIDFGEHDGILFLVMELLVGRTLRERLDAGPVEIGEALAITAQIAAALDAAHRIRLVHRDIKPENVFLEAHADGERVRVVDFGLAFIAAAPGDADPRALGRLTDEGILGGTPAYMSPEQVRGRAVGPACDIYSLGCVLYELISGHPPFVGPVADLLARHAYAPVTPLRQAAADRDIEPALDELVLAMLAKSPPLRPPPAAVVERIAALTEPGRVPGRSGAHLGDRSSRMVARAELVVDDPGAEDVGWLGAWDDDLTLGLATAGLRARRDAATGPGALVFAPGADLPALTALVAGGAIVVTDVTLGDVAGITARLRAGVADVVTRPVRPDDLARKLTRASARRHAPRP